MKQIPDWRQVLRAAPRAPRDAGAFWADFEARRRIYQQHARAPRRLATSWTLAALTGAAAAVAVVLGAYAFMGGGAATTVRSCHVGGRYSSVMLLTDKDSPATILWIAGMDSEEGG